MSREVLLQKFGSKENGATFMYPTIGNTSSYIKQELKAAYKLRPMACSAYLRCVRMTELSVKRMKKL